MNLETLKTVGSNSTAKSLAKMLAARERFSRETDIKRLYVSLIREGQKLVPNEYNGFFKDLEEAGVGSIIHGRKGNPTRFKWNYSLKDVGNRILHPEAKRVIQELPEQNIPKKRGRPLGSKNKASKSTDDVGKAINILRKSNLEVVFMLKSLDGSSVPVSFDELEKATREVANITA